MSKKTGVAPIIDAEPIHADNSFISGAGETASDLERLRDILFGQQARTTEQQLRALEQRVDVARRDLAQDLQTQVTDLTTQLQALRRDLEAQLQQQAAEGQAAHAQLSERLEALQAESRQQHDRLRQEMLALTAALEDSKASRHDLGQMLIEIGQRLQAERQRPH